MFAEKFISAISRVNHFCKLLLRAVCAAFMTALTLVVLWGVATRYILGEQPAYTEELARMFLICATFFGGALAFAEASHIGLDYFVSKFSPSARKLCALIAVGFSIFFVAAILIYGGTKFITTSMESANMMVSAPIYLWQIYLCIPISGVFSLMFLIESFAEIICGKGKFLEIKTSDEGGEL